MKYFFLEALVSIFFPLWRVPHLPGFGSFHLILFLPLCWVLCFIEDRQVFIIILFPCFKFQPNFINHHSRHCLKVVTYNCTLTWHESQSGHIFCILILMLFCFIRRSAFHCHNRMTGICKNCCFFLCCFCWLCLKGTMWVSHLVPHVRMMHWPKCAPPTSALGAGSLWWQVFSWSHILRSVHQVLLWRVHSLRVE
jgi:hypothetical protein